MLKKTKIKTFLQLAVVSLFLTTAKFAHALEASYPTIFGLSLGDSPSLPEYAKYFFNIGIISAGILAALVIAFGGIYYLVDFGRGKFKSEGMEWIKAGTLGLLLIMCAYLIVYTINPYLVIFDLKGLAPLTFLSNLFSSPSSSLPVEVYTEIPIGILTENLLTRTMDCYNFDGNGDPIEGEPLTVDDGRKLYGPTYLKHDQADCFLKLAEAIEKKSDIANQLSIKIAELMQQCQCSEGTCDTQWNSKCPEKPPCNKAKGICKPILDESCCPADVKKQIEEGLITLDQNEGGTSCPGSEKKYTGLEEFRSKQFGSNYFAIKTFVEIQPPAKVNGKDIWIINNGNCQVCIYNCPATCTEGDNQCLNKKQNCEEQQSECLVGRQKCLQKNSPWYKLKLIDQLTYLRGRAEEIKQKVQQDINNLTSAEDLLGKCYLADAYVDFFKVYEKTDKKEKTILVQKTFSDPETQKIVNPAKYCEGFQYNNSSCYSQCQKVCPGTSSQEVGYYKKAQSCNNIALKERQKCLEQQAKYIKEIYDNRSCIAGASPFKTFPECMDNCNQNCLSSCEKSCLSAEELKKCQDKCNNDSKCLLDNEDKCLINFNRLKDCSDSTACVAGCSGDNDCIQKCNVQYNDINFVKNCIENSASLCTYCSDQYAGYPECLTPSYYNQGNYSSSFLCSDPNSQLCKYGITTTDVNGNTVSQTADSCTVQNLETSKCPVNSKCPECPCDIVSDQPTENSYAGQTEEPTGTDCSDANKNNGEDTAYRVCSPTCDNYAFNDDPLTFYCNQTWWKKDETKNTEPLGSSKICPKNKEIPVGRTVDDAEAWGQAFMQVINDFTQKADEMINYIKKIGDEKKYCQCDSTCGGSELVCKPECEDFTVFDEDNKKIGEGCAQSPCSGNPCQKMINLLLGKEAGNEFTDNDPDACPAGQNSGFEGVNWYLEQVKDGLKEVEDFVLKDKRSDILKELEYSRQGINTCSTNYDKETSILSCTRVEDEIMPPLIATSNPAKTIVGTNKPVASYCYGQELGKILGTEPLADNWFCCQTK